MTKFELSILIGTFIGAYQVVFGTPLHGFYTLGSMVIVCLLAIVAYLRQIYSLDA